MLTFSHYRAAPITEGAAPKSSAPHIEDMMFHNGEGGFRQSLDALNAVHDQTKGGFNSTRVLARYEGNPSIVFGHHPETNRFFISLNDDFPDKLDYTPEDILKNHREDAPVMTVALPLLTKITPPQGIYCGDVLSFEINEENPKKSNMTMALTARYYGHDMEHMQSSAEPSIQKFKKDSHVTLVPPQAEMGPTGGGDELKLDHNLRQAERRRRYQS